MGEEKIWFFRYFLNIVLFFLIFLDNKKVFIFLIYSFSKIILMN